MTPAGYGWPEDDITGRGLKEWTRYPQGLSQGVAPFKLLIEPPPSPLLHITSGAYFFPTTQTHFQPVQLTISVVDGITPSGGIRPWAPPAPWESSPGRSVHSQCGEGEVSRARPQDDEIVSSLVEGSHHIFRDPRHLGTQNEGGRLLGSDTGTQVDLSLTSSARQDESTQVHGSQVRSHGTQSEETSVQMLTQGTQFSQPSGQDQGCQTTVGRDITDSPEGDGDRRAPSPVGQFLQDNSPHRLVEIGYDDEAMTPTSQPQPVVHQDQLGQQCQPSTATCAATSTVPRGSSVSLQEDSAAVSMAACMRCPFLHAQLDASQVWRSIPGMDKV